MKLPRHLAAFGGFRNALRCGGAIVLAALFLACRPAIAAAQPHQEKVTDPRHREELKKIQNTALHEKNEFLFFVLITDKGVEILTPCQDNNTETSVDLVFTELHDALHTRKNIRTIEYIHTHPLQALAHQNIAMLSQADVEKLRKTPELLSPLPPSLTDFVAAAITEEEFADAGASLIECRVVDPTGTWKYKGSAAPGTAYDDLRRAVREHNAAKKIYEAQGDRATEQEMNDSIDKEIALGTFMWGHKEFTPLHETQNKLFMLNGSSDKKAKQSLIEEYIRLAKKAGITMSYEPLEK